ncbi:hypothetical protein BU25DRAFT_416385 [Macroventuria anomochaeta]|uniref:Uncharacterized protein n=1 Tax=Macroventuria anomochaeta TaxID=301207 RepID=A0ACB6RHB5_9PLEO|nr:uncharacterized protein BU25DRAFT_416385 [Macroventuria anomochaeta]KAF2621092.1 hypothetical protein BU25DRAFT_416385 [Macroventuria anomochaeta]
MLLRTQLLLCFRPLSSQAGNSRRCIHTCSFRVKEFQRYYDSNLGVGCHWTRLCATRWQGNDHTGGARSRGQSSLHIRSAACALIG